MKLLYSLLTPTDRKAQTTQRLQMPQGMESHGMYDSADVHLPVIKTNTKNSKRYLHIAIAMLMGTVSMGAMAIDDPLAGKYAGWSGQPTYTTTITDGSESTQLTGKLTSPSGQFNSPPIINNPSNSSAQGTNYFVLTQDADNRNVKSTLTFTSTKLLSDLTLTLYDIDAATYWDEVTIYGHNSKSNNPNQKIAPIEAPDLFSNSKVEAVLKTSGQSSWLILRLPATNKKNTPRSPISHYTSSEFAKAVTFSSSVDTIVIEYGNYTFSQPNPNYTEYSNPQYQSLGIRFDTVDIGGSTYVPTVPLKQPIKCPDDWKPAISDTFASEDYHNLLDALGETPFNGKTTPYIYINGINDESYLDARMKTTFANIVQQTSGAIRVLERQAPLGGRVQTYVEQNQTVANSQGYSIIEYEFKNKFDNNPQEVRNLTLSIYDIDYNSKGYSDKVTITGFTNDGIPVKPIRKSIGTDVVEDSISNSYYGNQESGNNICRSQPFDSRCYVTVKFESPIVKYQIKYNNKESFSSYISQEIFSTLDGYCYQPQPRLVYSKDLSANRIHDTDQFTVQVLADNSNITFPTNTTTEGTGNTIDAGTGTTGTFKVNPTKTYTLTEAASGTTDLSNYQATYKCANANGSEIESTNPLNPKAFKMTYGQEWTCTVTNAPKKYVFEGTVFNDNGGISDSKASPTALGGVYDNDKYFNGQLDEGEKGIYETGLKVSLTDCNNHIIDTADVSSSGDNIGKYTISIPKSELNGATSVCLVEHTGDDLSENLQTYSIDTSPNKLPITLDSEQLEYPNQNFGNVTEENTALVLVKRQYFHDCKKTISDIQNAEIDPSGGPTAGFSKDTITDDQGGTGSIGIKQCIAYRIDAYNRGFVELSQVIIKDTLPERSILTTPLPNSPDDISFSDSSIGESENGQVITNPFILPKRTNSSELKRKAIFFNTNFNIN
ncbi:hypothetical protein [Psychrobacter sp. I-STPA6b]|uniref:hypothetical protein n=1 Tax=Psychrobacter sp. I-STPA6b TaxID=2585718 RepID=UPI001D0CB69B|nr:hypothetical protein [Psychrobacter sp. I-STPA6b]